MKLFDHDGDVAPFPLPALLRTITPDHPMGLGQERERAIHMTSRKGSEEDCMHMTLASWSLIEDDDDLSFSSDMTMSFPHHHEGKSAGGCVP